MTKSEAIAQLGVFAAVVFPLAVYAAGCAIQQLFWPVRRKQVTR